MEYKYDVFISYSRKDYADGSDIIPNNAISAIMDVFRKNDISFWFDYEGIYCGQEFKNIIIDAIHSSKIFLFVSSSNSNKSKWTLCEVFEAFDADKYIIPFKIEDCDYHKNLKFELRPLDYILYCGNEENAMRDLVRSVLNYKKELAAERRKEEEKGHLEEIRRRISETADDFRINAIKQETLIEEITELYKSIGIDHKSCPACGKSVNIDETYCERCGWSFPALPSLNDDNSTLNQGLLTTIKTNWKCINQVTDTKTKIKSLESDNKALKQQLKRVTDECKKFQDTIKSLELCCNKLKTDVSTLQKTTCDREKEVNIQKLENQKLQEDLKRKTDECKQYQEDIDALKQQAIQEKMKKRLKSKGQINQEIIQRAKTSSAKDNVPPADYIGRVNLYKIISILKDEYGIDLSKNDFRNCNTISDLIDVVAKKADLD